MKDGQVVDGFMGAYPEDVVTQFVEQPVADRRGGQSPR